MEIKPKRIEFYWNACLLRRVEVGINLKSVQSLKVWVHAICCNF
jgi:hypothetical protein